MLFATWTSPCLYGKLQHIAFFATLDVAVSIGEAATPHVFCYVDVAVSIGEAATPRVFCYVDVAVSIGEAANFVLFATWTSPCL